MVNCFPSSHDSGRDGSSSAFQNTVRNKSYLGDGSRRDGSENSCCTAVLLEYITVSAIISEVVHLGQQYKDLGHFGQFQSKDKFVRQGKNFPSFGFSKN